MANVPVPVAQIMNDPDLSISSSTFTPNMIIKRASFRGGETPDHLEDHTFGSGCGGLTGTVVYEGKTIPKTAACRAGADVS